MVTVLCYNANRSASWWEIDFDFKYIIFDEGISVGSIFIVGRMELFVTSISSEPGNHPLPNLLLCLSKLSDKQWCLGPTISL